MNTLFLRWPRHFLSSRPGSGGALWCMALVFGLIDIAWKYPGQMNSDARSQWAEAISGHFTDWHPPVTAWFWSWWRPETTGAAPVLMFQLVLHWLGFALAADGLRRAGRPGMGWIVLCAGAFPLLSFFNASILKDVGMASAFIAAFGLVFHFRVRGQPLPWWALSIAGILLAYGTLARANGIFALGPLLVYAFARRVRFRSPVAACLAALAVALAAMPVSSFVNRHLLGAAPSRAIHSLMLFDLNGMAAHTGDQTLLPPAIRMPPEQLKSCYTPFFWDVWYAGPCGFVWERLGPPESALRAELPGRWLRSIARHPVAYAVHRLKAFNSAMYYLVPAQHCRFVFKCGGVDKMDARGREAPPPATRSDYGKASILSWPATWLGLGLVLVFLSYRPAARQSGDEAVWAVQALSLSASLYLAAGLFVGVATTMRYSYWTVLAVLLALLLAADAWRRGRLPWGRPGRVALSVLLLCLGGGLAARIFDIKKFII